MKSSRFGFCKVVFFSLILFCITGCEYWNKDMLAYLEYWSSTVQVGRVDKSGATFQQNNAGIDTIPVTATPTITAALINPKGYSLEVTTGTSSGSSVIIDNIEVAKLVETPVLSENNTLFSVKLGAGNADFEHQTFTLTFEPVRTDNQLAVPGKSITLRYNTPPAAPRRVVRTEDGTYELVSGGTKWEASEGRLYWAYYKEPDETKQNCAKSFKINGQLVPVTECNPEEGKPSLNGLILYSRHTGSASTSVAAVDSEGITGSAIVSGQVAPASITYNGNGNSYGDVPTPQSFEQGTQVTLANQGDLRRSGYSFDGWNTADDGSGKTYDAGSEHVFTEDTTLYAKWNPMKDFYVSSSGSDESSHDGSEAHPFGTVDNALRYINEINKIINDGSQNFIIHVEGTFEAKQEDVSENQTSVVNIEPGQKLTLTIQGKDGHTATINATTLNSNGAMGRVMYVGANANVTLKNIELIGGKVDGFGGGVYIDGGTLTMETGSSIKNNTASYGGGVYVNIGEFNMTGGTINGNEVTSSGGGVYVKDTASTFKMSGGTISGNNARNWGGGVYNSSGTFNMSETATISGNEAYLGGGVHNSSGTFNMSGGTIRENKANSGGGVYVDEKGTFTMKTGSSIKNNTADTGGGVYNRGTFNMNGGTIGGDINADKNTANDNGGGVYNFGGTFNMSGGIISGNEATQGGGVYNYGETFNMSGSATVDSNNVVYLPSGKTITVGALTGTGTVATITPKSYEGDAGAAVQVLDGGEEPANLTSFYTRFSVTPRSEYPYNWEIYQDGTIFGVP